MRKKDLIVVGSGNPDIIKLIEDINEQKDTFNFLGFLEKDEALVGKKIHGYEIIGDDNLLKSEFKNCAVINNVAATTKLRMTISDKLKNVYGIKEFPNLIHPTVNLRHVDFGIGNIIYQNVAIGADVKIGDFNLIFYSSVIGHEAVIGNYNLLGAHVLIGSRSNIANKILISNSCTISSSMTICDDVFVGAGSLVIKPINEPMKVFGSPARKMII